MLCILITVPKAKYVTHLLLETSSQLGEEHLQEFYHLGSEWGGYLGYDISDVLIVPRVFESLIGRTFEGWFIYFQESSCICIYQLMIQLLECWDDLGVGCVCPMIGSETGMAQPDVAQ